MPSCLIVSTPVIVADVSAAALQIFKVSVQLVEMIVIDAALVVHTVGHIKVIRYMISYAGTVYSLYTEIYLFQ